MPMPKVSAKRQITLPVDQCRLAGINPGDEYESYVDNDGHITLFKKVAGAAKGVIEGIPTDKRMSDDMSLRSSVVE